MKRIIIAVVALAAGLAVSPGLWTNVDKTTGVSSFAYDGSSSRTFEIDYGDELEESTCCPGNGRRMAWCSVENVTTDTSFPPVFVEFEFSDGTAASSVPIYPPGTGKVSGVNSLEFDLKPLTGTNLYLQSDDVASVVVACSAGR